MKTFNSKMNHVYSKGLQLVKKHETAIKAEWEELLLHLKKVGKKSYKIVDDTTHFLSTYLFQVNDDVPTGRFSKWENPQIMESVSSNQYILTLLENGIHKAIQSGQEYTYQDHQAVKYLFSKISERIRTQPYQEHFTIEHFLQQIVSSKQIPIKWAAMVTFKNEKYTLVKSFHQNKDQFHNHLDIKADSIYELSELLLQQMDESMNQNVLPIPYEDGTLLICSRDQNASDIIPLITYSLQVFKKGQNSFKESQQMDQWKDSVILFNETIMRAQTFDEAVENITAGFVEYLPFERCALFSYSYNEQMGFGLYGHRLDNKAIQNINEDIENLPIIQDNLQFLQMFGQNMNYLQPFYIKDASLGFPERYVKQFELKTVVVAPIFTSTTSKLLGAAILDQGPDKTFKINEDTFSALIKFGQSAGEMLSKFYNDQIEPYKGERVNFSPREVEVLKLMAEGASTSEAATTLNLSEYTVRDYVSAIMQKMNARNRTEAVARALREGMIK
ncbi:response regulator transcription factor [Virgibacillus sp. MSP4-1]|uniref:response regulator transcription factor n=1 Tax=Virgibacillus sp. MSP4-1 TaxID=2700081 RepID=UPI0003A900C8|nr:response regulator transcription factor [Virgibacillus sp. MSP4-1]QHS22697.1 response regulator transcription factor [Virgibacillus sp. MSP4-1]